MENYKRKYEQAMFRMNKWVEGSEITDPKEVAEFVFPELCESEDEKIRKELIEFVKSRGGFKQEYIAWLEKQGEQKPVDKVEPKFKVGDWIINSEGMLRHILAVDKTGYQTDYGWLTHDIYDNTYHLWTIQDARKGDILQANKCTLIFDSLTKDIDDNIVISSWYYCDTKTFYGMGISQSDLWIIEGVVPATKEQRDLLFQKMKEAGYEWDAEKKELKKIERKPVVIIPKFHEGDVIKPKDGGHEPWKIMQVDILDKKYRFKDGYVIHFSQENDYELVEQKPTWSEEDEQHLKEVIFNMHWAIKNCVDKEYAEKEIEKHIYWLKSLEERYTWKPSDEQMKQLGWVAEQNKDNMIGKELMSLYQELKKLKGE